MDFDMDFPSKFNFTNILKALQNIIFSSYVLQNSYFLWKFQFEIPIINVISGIVLLLQTRVTA